MEQVATKAAPNKIRFMVISLCRFFVDSRYGQFAQRFVRLLFFGECFIEKLDRLAIPRRSAHVLSVPYRAIS